MIELRGLLVGLFAGAGYAITGFFKAKMRNRENFEYKKFFKTIVLGALLGAVSYYLGLDMTGII